VAIFDYKDLCIDAVDPVLVGRFWADGLGLEFHLQSGGDTYLTGPTPQHTIWVNAVPEMKSVKHRLHLDVNARSIAEWLVHGAVVTNDGTFPWTVMSDPEGGEFCLFVRDEFPSQRLDALVMDCVSSESSAALAQWWASGLGAEVVNDERGFWSVVRIPGAPFRSFDFIPVHESKTAKNRLHIDVTAQELNAVVQHGAHVLRPRDAEISWTICGDPEGNEFCVFTPR
jgi:hypothetical protein